LERGDQICGFFLECLILSNDAEFIIDALGPIADLVVYNVDALESVTEPIIMLHNCAEFLLHHDNFAVIAYAYSSSAALIFR